MGGSLNVELDFPSIMKRSAPVLRLREALLSFLYPEVCQLCRVQSARATSGYVCDDCRSKLSFIEPPFCDRCGLPYAGEIQTAFECSNCQPLKLEFRYARSIVAAKGVGLELIHRYKYHRALWFDPLFAELLAAHARPQIPSSDWDVIVPVPLHPLKQREREFNQAERLADHLSLATGLPVDRQCIKRVAITRTQTTLSRAERATNVHHVFEVAGTLPSTRRRVILIDDVLTTGATLSECAGALRRAGAEDVCAWTLARGL